MISLFVILLHLIYLDKRFDCVDGRLIDITSRTGIHTKYVEDGNEGKSYIMATNMVEEASKSLTFVGYWEPFPEYQANNTSVMKGESLILDARKKFYQTVMDKIDEHKFDKSPFHRRIVQVPKEYVDKRLPLEVDPAFFKYMNHAVRVQANTPKSCVVKKSSAFFNINFTIIDNRYVVIPILTHVKNLLQARHGALIIEDIDGQLIAILNSIYWILESRATPIDFIEIDKN